MYQGELGDCYFISSLGTIAKASPAAIRNMFIDNGDGTWTVRFYANGTADYVTVDNMLPTDSNGYLVYADYGFALHQLQQQAVDPAGRKGLCRVERDRQRGPRRHQQLCRHRGRLDVRRGRPGARPRRHQLRLSDTTSTSRP